MLKDITKQELIQELENRVADKILEPTNFELLKKLIEKADTLDEWRLLYFCVFIYIINSTK